MAKYLSVAETAKLVRQSLKEAFPGFKFSVRSSSYAGGASIGVRWIDGPNDAMVDAVIKRYQGSYFDGMTDFSGSVYALVDGQQVRFGADHVSSHRDMSVQFLERALAKARRCWGEERMQSVAVFDGGCGAYFTGDYEACRLAGAEASKLTTYLAPRKSKTAGKVIFLGNDGHSEVGALQVEGQTA